MQYEPKEIKLKNGVTAIFRSPREEDAAALLDYLKITAEETPYLLRYPEECVMSVEQEEGFIRGIQESAEEVMIVCEAAGKLVGNCQLSRQRRIKTRHRASVGIALIKEYWGLGIGTAMLAELIRLAKEQGIEQLELEFIEGNERAKALYEKMGFHIVGAKPNAIRLKDGTMLREFFMVRKLI